MWPVDSPHIKPAMHDTVSCWDAIFHKNKVKDEVCVKIYVRYWGYGAWGTKMKPIVGHTLRCQLVIFFSRYPKRFDSPL